MRVEMRSATAAYQDIVSSSDAVAELGDAELALPEVDGLAPSALRQRAQNAKADRLFDIVEHKVIKEEQSEVPDLSDLTRLSTEELLARGDEQRDSDPRDYQMELLERAKQHNTIAILDTGSGKTLIAALLIKHMMALEEEAGAAGKPPRIVFFLVDKVILVFQQYKYLINNLNYTIGRFCGALGCDLWSKEVWAEQFTKCQVIVCTAEILYQCLAHAFITIQQVSLLIFDEAHHAKKDHPYSRIIRDFYFAEPDITARPRVFGMTASPVDVEATARSSLQETAAELESLLDSRIVTTSDSLMLTKFVHRPEPRFLPFDALRVPFETDLFRQLWARYWDLPEFKPIFEHAKDISSHLGRWCSDKYWSFAFGEAKARRIEANLKKRSRSGNGLSANDLDGQVVRLHQAHEEISTYPVGIPRRQLDDLSSKVVRLFELLEAFFQEFPAGKCLVFVERRSTARLLSAVANCVGGDYLKADILIGTAGSDIAGLQWSIREQVLTVMRFRKGELNCLFATSVAEEGLDIQTCGCVIRFDLSKSMIQYVQSRGRARQKGAWFVHLIEKDSFLDRHRLDTMRNSEDIMRLFCQLLPKDRLLSGNRVEVEDPRVKDHGKRVYSEPSTGAKLTYDFSLIVLAHFVECLPRSDDDDRSISYHVSARGGKFVCEVVLPTTSPIRAAVGREYKRRSNAKRSAAFEACLALRRGKYLDANLLPIYAKSLPAMRNALLAITSKRCKEYDLQLKPSIWSTGRDTCPTALFLTVLFLEGSWDRPVQPLGLLTRTRLPALPTFPLFRADGARVEVISVSVHSSLAVNEEALAQLTCFTLSVYKDLFNKVFERNESHMSYWLAPLCDHASTSVEEFSDPAHFVDWTVCANVCIEETQSWSATSAATEFVDKFIIDPFHGGRRWFTVAVRPDLCATDPVPPGVAHGDKRDHILHFSVQNMWKNSAKRRQWNEEQPVFEADQVSHRLNVLAEPSEAEKAVVTRCFVCLEPFRISRIPSRVVGSCLIFPAILYRIEAYLIALEFCQKLELKITPALALEAITKDSDNTDDTQGKQINWQRGMGPNYERLEFLGDCFLKMATSISLYAKNVGNDEEQMHIARMVMICNKNLFKTATEDEYYKYIRTQAFSRRTWYPQGLQLLQGKGSKEGDKVFDMKHPLGDKSIADVCEALIGAALLSHFKSGYDDPAQMDEAVKAVTIFVANSDHAMQCWDDYSGQYTIPDFYKQPATASQRSLVEKLTASDNYRFTKARLLQSAFQHPSVPRAHTEVPSYQRLEFLGDSLLDMTAVMFLYKRYPTRDSQWLTEHKMAMVSNKFLGTLCVKLGFQRNMDHRQPFLPSRITTFIEELEQAELEANGARHYWTTIADPPKCLADLVESYVGAMFVDSGFRFAEVQRFFDEHIAWYFEDMAIYDTFANNHPLLRLNLLINQTWGCHEWALRAKEYPAIDDRPVKYSALVMVHDDLVAWGHASSSRYAKIKACSKAIDVLEKLDSATFRQQFKCDCKKEGSAVVDGTDVDVVSVIDEAIGTAV